MNLKIVILDSAKQDLAEIKEYILGKFSNKAWNATLKQIKAAIEPLSSFPLSGILPEEIRELGLTHYRQLIVGMNRIIYEVGHDKVFIHIVADTRKDFVTLLTRRLINP